MKLLKRGPCRRGPRGGNVKLSATLEENAVDDASDRGSTPLASTNGV